jgi:hypothetical protein
MTATDDLYIAADERAREARRAGLQAKKDEQPLNTTRSYASKQREWKARPPPSPSSLLSTVQAFILTRPFIELVPYATCCPGRLTV